MEPKPVPHSDQPGYPTRREVLAGAASFALLNLTGYRFIFAASEDGKTLVAPVFKHGEGRGATGCVVVSPPVFLSEEEGMQILREELAKHGIKLKAGGTLDDIRVPVRFLEHKIVDKGNGKKVYEEEVVEADTLTKPLKLDGIDSDKKIEVEFISKQDYFNLGGPSSSSTAQSYNFREVAEFVATQVKKQGKDQVFFGVFYDPLSRPPRRRPKEGEEFDWAAERKRREKVGKEESMKLLRQQARDFAAWLKQQKAIQ
jgi:hypothetical protein